MVFQECTKGLMGCIMFNPWSTINILFNEYNSKGSLKFAGPWLLPQSQTMEWKVWTNNGFWMEGYPSANEILYATWEHAALRQRVYDAEHVDSSKFWLLVLVVWSRGSRGSQDMRFCCSCDKEVSSSWFQPTSWKQFFHVSWVYKKLSWGWGDGSVDRACYASLRTRVRMLSIHIQPGHNNMYL